MKPRIVICATQVPFAYGGAEMLVDSLRDELKARDFEVDVVAIPFHWPTRADDARAASAHLPRLDGEHLADLTEAVRFAAPPGSALELEVDELRWQDRPLGRLSATLA